MFCSKCGTQNEDTSRFCKSCGTAMGAATPPPASVSANAAFEGAVPWRKKNVAIVLVVLFGWLGFIYTWRKDYLTFIFGIIGILLCFKIFGDSEVDILVTGASWAIPIVMNAVRPKSFFENI